MKICIAATVMLGLIVTVPIASFAAGDNDKSASSAKATVHHKKPKKGFSDTVYDNAGYPSGNDRTLAPADAQPSLEYGYMNTPSYGFGASELGYAPAYRRR